MIGQLTMSAWQERASLRSVEVRSSLSRITCDFLHEGAGAGSAWLCVFLIQINLASTYPPEIEQSFSQRHLETLEASANTALDNRR